MEPYTFLSLLNPYQSHWRLADDTYVIVSYAKFPYRETMIFAADRDGNVSDWGGLWRANLVLEHKEALHNYLKDESRFEKLNAVNVMRSVVNDILNIKEKE